MGGRIYVNLLLVICALVAFRESHAAVDRVFIKRRAGSLLDASKWTPPSPHLSGVSSSTELRTLRVSGNGGVSEMPLRSLEPQSGHPRTFSIVSTKHVEIDHQCSRQDDASYVYECKSMHTSNSTVRIRNSGAEHAEVFVVGLSGNGYVAYLHFGHYNFVQGNQLPLIAYWGTLPPNETVPIKSPILSGTATVNFTDPSGRSFIKQMRLRDSEFSTEITLTLPGEYSASMESTVAIPGQSGYDSRTVTQTFLVSPKYLKLTGQAVVTHDLLNDPLYWKIQVYFTPLHSLPEEIMVYAEVYGSSPRSNNSVPVSWIRYLSLPISNSADVYLHVGWIAQSGAQAPFFLRNVHIIDLTNYASIDSADVILLCDVPTLRLPRLPERSVLDPTVMQNGPRPSRSSRKAKAHGRNLKGIRLSSLHKLFLVPGLCSSDQEFPEDDFLGGIFSTALKVVPVIFPPARVLRTALDVGSALLDFFSDDNAADGEDPQEGTCSIVAHSFGGFGALALLENFHSCLSNAFDIFDSIKNVVSAFDQGGLFSGVKALIQTVGTAFKGTRAYSDPRLAPCGKARELSPTSATLFLQLVSPVFKQAVHFFRTVSDDGGAACNSLFSTIFGGTVGGNDDGMLTPADGIIDEGVNMGIRQGFCHSKGTSFFSWLFFSFRWGAPAQYEDYDTNRLMLGNTAIVPKFQIWTPSTCSASNGCYIQWSPYTNFSLDISICDSTGSSCQLTSSKTGDTYRLYPSAYSGAQITVQLSINTVPLVLSDTISVGSGPAPAGPPTRTGTPTPGPFISVTAPRECYIQGDCTLDWTTSSDIYSVEIQVCDVTYTCSTLQYASADASPTVWTPTEDLAASGEWFYVLLWDSDSYDVYGFSDWVHVIPVPKALNVMAPCTNYVCTTGDLCYIDWEFSGDISTIDIWLADVNYNWALLEGGYPATDGFYIWMPSVDPGDYLVYLNDASDQDVMGACGWFVMESDSTPTPTPTRSRTRSPSRSQSAKPTPSRTRPPTPTRTLSQTPSPESIPTDTPSPTSTRTSSRPTATRSRTPPKTPTSSPVPKTIDVLSPEAYSVCFVNSPCDIVWEYTGAIDTVEIWMGDETDTYYVGIESGIAASDSYYSWTPSDTSTTPGLYFIAIYDEADSDVYGTSNWFYVQSEATDTPTPTPTPLMTPSRAPLRTPTATKAAFLKTPTFKRSHTNTPSRKVLTLKRTVTPRKPTVKATATKTRTRAALRNTPSRTRTRTRTVRRVLSQDNQNSESLTSVSTPTSAVSSATIGIIAAVCAVVLVVGAVVTTRAVYVYRRSSSSQATQSTPVLSQVPSPMHAPRVAWA